MTTIIKVTAKKEKTEKVQMKLQKKKKMKFKLNLFLWPRDQFPYGGETHKEHSFHFE